MRPAAAVTPMPAPPAPASATSSSREFPSASDDATAEAGTKEKKVGVLFGARLGVVVPTGQTGSQSSSANPDVAQFFGTGAGLQLDFGIRFAHHFTALAFYEHDVLSKGRDFSNAPDVSASHNVFGLGMQFAASQSAATGSGPFGEVDLLLVNEYGLSETQSSGFASCTSDAKFTGPALRLGGGFHVPVGSAVLLSPQIGVELGEFGSLDVTNSGQCQSSSTGSLDLSNSALHVTVFAGIGGGFYIGE
jgi:hypothetical protein